MAEEKTCTFADFEYAHDSKMCLSGKCVKCNDGEWEETDQSCPC